MIQGLQPWNRLLETFCSLPQFSGRAVRNPDDIRALPFAAKDGLRDWRVTDCPRPPVAVAKTSGTTGTPMGIYVSQEAFDAMVARSRAFVRRIAQPGDRLLSIAPANSLTMNYVAARAAMAEGVGFALVTDDDIAAPRCRTLLEQFKPTGIYTTPTAAFAFFRTHGTVPSLRGGLRTGEPLTDAELRELEAVSGVRWFDLYGAHETSLIAAQCAPDGEREVFDEGLHLEILQDDGSCVEEGEGSLLVTDFNNHAMPIIRYRLGDRVRLTGSGGARRLAFLGRDDANLKVGGVFMSKTRLLALAEGRLGQEFCAVLLPRTPGEREHVVILSPHADRAFDALEAWQEEVKVPLVLRQCALERLPRTPTGKRVQFVDLRERQGPQPVLDALKPA
jgi:phenylacetate-coenzyme A ligase PaaK-like adenylate-forming protein